MKKEAGVVRKILAGLIILASIVIVVSFFMPWARVSVSIAGISKKLTDVISGEKLQDTPIAGKAAKELEKITDAITGFGDIDIKTTVSGYNIPQMVNNRTSKAALSIAQILSKSTSGLEQKIYLVYLLPLLGIVCGILAIIGLKSKSWIIIMLVISGIVGIAGLYNLSTANLVHVAVKVDIMSGLWNTMYAFLFIFLSGVAWLVLGRKA
jgi:hypothetical protein